MKRVAQPLVVALLAVSAAAWMGGCPMTGGSDSLTDQEDSSLGLATHAAESLAQALTTAQSPTGAQDGGGDSSLAIPVGTQNLTFGVCPEVSLTASNDGLLNFELDVDFSDSGCSPMGTSDYVCSGSARGSFDTLSQTMNIALNNISCDGSTLAGSMGGSWERGTSEVDIDGNFELTWTYGSVTVQTQGSGQGCYNFEDYTTTIDSFTGTTSDGTHTYNVAMTAIMMSFPTYGSFIPFAGQMTLSGSGIRTYIVQFGTDSPTTGAVQVSIDGSPFFAANLYAS